MRKILPIIVIDVMIQNGQGAIVFPIKKRELNFKEFETFDYE